LIQYLLEQRASKALNDDELRRLIDFIRVKS